MIRIFFILCRRLIYLFVLFVYSDDYYKKFVPENGGTPIRSLVVSTWRSGTTFVGDLLNSVPGNYYHYEPLLDYEIIQIRGPPLAEQALQILKNLFHCNYTSLGTYILRDKLANSRQFE